MIGRRYVWDELTPREHEYAAALVEGLSNAGIAARLFVCGRAVEKAMQQVLWKLTGLLHDQDPSVNRRVKAALAYLEMERP